MKIGIYLIIAGIILLFVGIFYMILSNHDFGSLDGITLCAIGIILLVLGIIIRKMQKVSKIKSAYDELSEDDSDLKE